jgi:hypothetical protein
MGIITLLDRIYCQVFTIKVTTFQKLVLFLYSVGSPGGASLNLLSTTNISNVMVLT